MQTFQHLINALSLGSLYAAIAIGYTMVFSVLRLVNFAHGDLMMMGAYLGYLCMKLFSLPLPAALAVSMALCGGFGVLCERFVYRRTKDQDTMMIAAVGVSLILEYGFMLLFGAQPHVIPPNPLSKVITVGGVSFTGVKLACVLLVVPALIALSLLLNHTKLGVGIRAVASNREAAQLCGIGTEKPTRVVFFLGSALAGCAGILYGSAFSMNPLMGMTIGLKAFAAAVVGGIGSISGAVLGAYLMAFAETACAVYLSSAYKDAVAFLILMVVLVFFPSGIFPKNSAAKRS